MDLSSELRKFIETAKDPLIVVLGPTASGKTALSLHLAKTCNGEIISTDSRQIYREMTISTDALTPENQQGIPHHLIGIVSPDETLTLADYKELATQKIREIQSRGKIPILTGGTGLYISAIIESYDVPKVAPDDELRRKLEEEVKIHGNAYLHKKLQKLDPQSAQSIHPNNVRYVIRALEINMLTGRAKKNEKFESPYDLFLVGIEYPRQELYARINHRVDEQLKAGLVEEVKSLLDHGYNEDLPSMSSLGVKEIVPYIKGESTLEDCVEILKRNTRRYAKRQMTWFRRYDSVHWLKPDALKNA